MLQHADEELFKLMVIILGTNGMDRFSGTLWPM
jgi:hypothetical protein